MLGRGKTPIFRDSLISYYNNYYPFELCYQWLSYGKEENFYCREFNFTLLDDKYCRYQSFDTVEQLKEAVVKAIPGKIDLGAIYNFRPRDRGLERIQAIQHELVIDIDISDYNDVRTCCSSAKICNKCWKFLAISCKVLDAALREDYGFIHIMWTFSGRRGIHAWICDENARYLDGKARNAIAESLQVIIGGEYIKRKVRLSGERIVYPINRALDIIRPYFVELCIEEQDILGTDERIHKFLEILTNDEMKIKIMEGFDQCTNGIQRWNVFVDYIREHVQSVEKHCHIIEEIMLQYIYPRIDINVTRDITHLLKSPFSIHPKSKNISIPFDPQKVDEFDIMAVPTLDGIIQELKDPHEEEMLKKFNESVQHLRDFINSMRNF